MSGSMLDAIIAEGTTWGEHYERINPNNIVCADGFKISVIAGNGAYCAPRPGFLGNMSEDYRGPYFEVECGFPSERPEPWDQWSQWCENTEMPSSTVYGYVPVEAVRALIESHGGEVPARAPIPGDGSSEC